MQYHQVYQKASNHFVGQYIPKLKLQIIQIQTPIAFNQRGVIYNFILILIKSLDTQHYSLQLGKKASSKALQRCNIIATFIICKIHKHKCSKFVALRYCNDTNDQILFQPLLYQGYLASSKSKMENLYGQSPLQWRLFHFDLYIHDNIRKSTSLAVISVHAQNISFICPKPQEPSAKYNHILPNHHSQIQNKDQRSKFQAIFLQLLVSYLSNFIWPILNFGIYKFLQLQEPSMKRQRGLATKTGINRQGWELSDFPVACDKCYGENPYMRMLKQNYGQECRICFRPFTVFKWKGNKGIYKRTCVCNACSKDKNICQVCTLDLEFGLPMDVRDKRCGRNGKDLINENFISTDNTKAKPPPPSIPPPILTKVGEKELVFVTQENDEDSEGQGVKMRVEMQRTLLQQVNQNEAQNADDNQANNNEQKQPQPEKIENPL